MTGDFKERLSMIIENYVEYAMGVEQGIQDYDEATAIHAIETLFIELVGEPEVFDKSKKYLTRSERTIVTRNVLRQELINKLRGTSNG